MIQLGLSLPTLFLPPSLPLPHRLAEEHGLPQAGPRRRRPGGGGGARADLGDDEDGDNGGGNAADPEAAGEDGGAAGRHEGKTAGGGGRTRSLAEAKGEVQCIGDHRNTQAHFHKT